MKKGAFIKVLERTVWIVRAEDGQFKAVDHMGTVLACDKYQSGLRYQMQQEAQERNILAIAVVVQPKNRQPNRKPRRYRRYPGDYKIERV